MYIHIYVHIHIYEHLWPWIQYPFCITRRYVSAQKLCRHPKVRAPPSCTFVNFVPIMTGSCLNSGSVESAKLQVNIGISI